MIPLENSIQNNKLVLEKKDKNMEDKDKLQVLLLPMVVKILAKEKVIRT